MKHLHTASLLFIIASVAHMAYAQSLTVRKPGTPYSASRSVPKKSTASYSGKVISLTASHLPAGAIIPASRNAGTPAGNTIVATSGYTPSATPPRIDPIQPYINPDRWQFYSYP